MLPDSGGAVKSLDGSFAAARAIAGHASPDLVRRDVTAAQPERPWVADITCTRPEAELSI